MCVNCTGRFRRTQTVLERLKQGPATSDQLAEAAGCSPRSVYRYITDLRNEGVKIDGEAGFGYMLRRDGRPGEGRVYG